MNAPQTLPKKELLFRKFSSLFRYQLRTKCSLSLCLYADENADTPECTHQLESDGRHALWKLALLLSALLLFLSALRCLTSLFCRK